MAEKKIGVGMIGLGGISYAHEAGYADMGDECTIVAMCDIHEDEAKNRCGIYNAKPYKKYEDLLNDPAVDMVDITSPHPLHYPMAKLAMEKGKHVLVEKPVTVNSEQGNELLKLAEKTGIKFSVAENTRFVTAYLEAEKILQKGTLGKILTVRTQIAGSEVYRIQDPTLWHGKAPYGGVILDSAVHNIYLYKWLFGGVKDVMGFASKLVPEGEVEDNGLIIGHLNNGAEFQLFTSCTIEIPWMERVEIYGDKGGLVIDQLANPVAKVYMGSSDIDGTVVENIPFDPFAWKFNSMMAEVKDFVAAIKDNRKPTIDPADTVYAVKVIEAIDESIKNKQFVAVKN
jgi:predicted dehydrogenase